MSSKSHKVSKVSLDFQSLVQTIPVTGALHQLQISGGANAPTATVLTVTRANPGTLRTRPSVAMFPPTLHQGE